MTALQLSLFEFQIQMYKNWATETLRKFNAVKNLAGDHNKQFAERLQEKTEAYTSMALALQKLVDDSVNIKTSTNA